MQRAITVVLGLIVALAVGPLLWRDVGSARAQSGCKSFQAIAQASLPTSTRLAASDKWGGPLYGSLEGESLLGILSGNDGVISRQGAIGQGSDGFYTIGFNCSPGNPYVLCADTLIIEVPESVFPSPPGMVGIGRFNGNTARIVGGTGRFELAWGNLNFTGPFIVWPDPNSPLPAHVSGRFNAELSGSMCGID